LLDKKLPIGQALDNATQNDVTLLINPSIHQESWKTLLELRNKFTNIKIGLGLHPCFISDHHIEHLPLLEQTLISEEVNIIGEIGLDKRYFENYLTQQIYFTEQLSIAQSLKLPVIIHSVRAHTDIIQILKNMGFTQGGIIHAFYGSLEEANQYLTLGFKLGIGGLVTYPKNTKLHKVIKHLPKNAIVLETDSPDMPLFQQLQKYNEPSNIPIIFSKICALRNECSRELQTQFWHNTRQALNLL
jgi:TatD DNase family protein